MRTFTSEITTDKNIHLKYSIKDNLQAKNTVPEPGTPDSVVSKYLTYCFFPHLIKQFADKSIVPTLIYGAIEPAAFFLSFNIRELANSGHLLSECSAIIPVCVCDMDPG